LALPATSRHFIGKNDQVVTVDILIGDSREVLASLPSQLAQCCVTSPPYFGLRDYGVDGQIGLEQSPDAYVAEMVAVFRGALALRADVVLRYRPKPVSDAAKKRKKKAKGSG
jgi:hypothetical protein